MGALVSLSAERLRREPHAVIATHEGLRLVPLQTIVAWATGASIPDPPLLRAIIVEWWNHVVSPTGECDHAS